MSSRRSSISKVDTMKGTATSKFKKQDTSRSKKSILKKGDESEPASPMISGKNKKGVKMDFKASIHK